MEDKQPQTKTRIHQLDYLKGIFILLMVIFHLALVEETYPMLRNAVYTFHMSAFLIISGYLANVDKNPGKFGHDMMRLAVPYVIFESLYILVQYFIGGQLGAHNAISQLTASDFVLRLATQPTGPYWYIHTLIISTIIYWLIYKVFSVSSSLSHLRNRSLSNSQRRWRGRSQRPRRHRESFRSFRHLIRTRF